MQDWTSVFSLASDSWVGPRRPSRSRGDQGVGGQMSICRGLVGLMGALLQDVALRCLVPGYRPQLATRGDHARAVAAMVTLAAGLNKAA